jgi:hypothetical protein
MYFIFLILPIFCHHVHANLWTETARMEDMQQFRALCGRYQVCRAYMEDSNARVTFFAPVNDVFLYNPDLRAYVNSISKKSLTNWAVAIPKLINL